MEAIKLYCIEKVRNSRGKITSYIMSDEKGDVGSFDKDGVIGLMRDKKYDVVNLQRDTIGRVVDKAIPNEKKIIEQITNKSNSNQENNIYDRAYGFIMKMGLVMIIEDANGRIKMTEPFDKLSNDIDIDNLQSNFERYVKNKYGVELTKLVVINTANNSKFIQYGLQYVEYTYLNTEDFTGFDVMDNFEVNYNVSHETHKVYSKVANLKGISNAFCGIIIYDIRDKMAVEWAEHQIMELNKKIKGLEASGTGGKTGRGTKGNSRVSLSKEKEVNKKSFIGMMRAFKR